MTTTNKIHEKHEFPCSRCNGKKIIKHFSHVEGGVCFECEGRGMVAYLAPVKPYVRRDFGPDEDTLMFGDGTLSGIAIKLGKQPRAKQMEHIKQAVGSNAPGDIRNVAARLAILDYPEATVAARMHYQDGALSALDAAMNAYRKALGKTELNYTSMQNQVLGNKISFTAKQMSAHLFAFGDDAIDEATSFLVSKAKNEAEKSAIKQARNTILASRESYGEEDLEIVRSSLGSE